MTVAIVATPFVLFWTVFVATGGVQFIEALVNQTATYRFAQTQGTILEAEVLDIPGARGRIEHDVRTRYKYRVGARDYQSERFRYPTLKTTGNWASQVVTQLPEGSRRPVYYNPANPQESVLVRGIEGIDLYFALIVALFSVPMVGGWGLLYYLCLHPYVRRETGGIRVWCDSAKIVVRAPGYPALLSFAMAFCLSSLPALAVIGFLMAMRPDLATMAVVWAAVLSCTLWFGGRQCCRNNSGRSDIVLDVARAMLTLPPMFGRRRETQVPIVEIGDVSVVTSFEEDELDESLPEQFVVVQREHDGDTRPLPVMRCHDPESAEHFADWLREQLRLARSPAAASPAKMAE